MVQNVKAVRDALAHAVWPRGHEKQILTSEHGRNANAGGLKSRSHSLSPQSLHLCASLRARCFCAWMW